MAGQRRLAHMPAPLPARVPVSLPGVRQLQFLPISTEMSLLTWLSRSAEELVLALIRPCRFGESWSKPLVTGYLLMTHRVPPLFIRGCARGSRAATAEGRFADRVKVVLGCAPGAAKSAALWVS